MILAVNIGNTNINLGLFDADTLVSQFRLDVIKLQQDCKIIDEYWAGISTGNINNIVTASVNPTVESIFFQWVENKFKKRPVKIGEDVQPKISIKVRNPEKVGIDRVLNAIAAYRLIKKDVIVVDVGSAITFDVVSSAGEFLGGVISPGIKMCADALHTQTGQLPLVKVKKVENVLGKDTEEAMISGIYWGSVGTINIVLEKLFEQLKSKPDVIATGGDAELITESVNYITKIIPHLTLDGIRIVYEESCTN
ncbi:MAG: type III pantothenate kinase [Candidatus Anammoxibacter sp.]